MSYQLYDSTNSRLVFFHLVTTSSACCFANMMATRSEGELSTSVNNRPFDADVILGHLGKCGRFQLQYFICMAYAILFPTAIILSVIFTTATPDHRCFVPDCDNETDPVYLAPWMSNETIQSLVHQQESVDWKCQFQNLSSSPSCVTINYTEYAKCDRWIYDNSVVINSVVTEVIYFKNCSLIHFLKVIF